MAADYVTNVNLRFVQWYSVISYSMGIEDTGEWDESRVFTCDWLIVATRWSRSLRVKVRNATFSSALQTVKKLYTMLM